MGFAHVCTDTRFVWYFQVLSDVHLLAGLYDVLR